MDEPEVDEITKKKCYLLGDGKSPYNEWFYLDEASVLGKKDALVRSRFDPYTHPTFQELSNQIGDARIFLLEGVVAQNCNNARLVRAQLQRRRGPFAQIDPFSAATDDYDDETLGGYWTYNNFLDCIGAGLPFERMYPVPCALS